MSERILLDACVLYPTLLRRLLIDTAEAGLYVPLWSARILDEWRHAAARSGPVEAALTDAEITELSTRFPSAGVEGAPETAAALSLPDPDDIHVLAAAITGGADSLLTLNLKDFPTRTLSRNGIFRREPDGLLSEFLGEAPEVVRPLVKRAAEDAARSIGADATPRSVLKRARLPRLGKAVFGQA